MTDYGEPDGEAAACRDAVGVADLSFLGKIELQADPRRSSPRSSPSSPAAARSAPGQAALHDEVWWCPITPEPGAGR